LLTPGFPPIVTFAETLIEPWPWASGDLKVEVFTDSPSLSSLPLGLIPLCRSRLIFPETVLFRLSAGVSAPNGFAQFSLLRPFPLSFYLSPAVKTLFPLSGVYVSVGVGDSPPPPLPMFCPLSCPLVGEQPPSTLLRAPPTPDKTTTRSVSKEELVFFFSPTAPFPGLLRSYSLFFPRTLAVFAQFPLSPSEPNSLFRFPFLRSPPHSIFPLRPVCHIAFCISSSFL